MGLTRETIEAMAPDQAALTAARGLIKPGKWPLRARAGGLIWGECQGSGANPYRVAADTDDPGSKCTCPSRKFPCKHALALMWMFVDDGAAFGQGDIPDWVSDWMGRRRKTSAAPTATHAAPKSLDQAILADEEKPVDPAAEAKRAAATAKRQADTTRLAMGALDELETWIADQLRSGLPTFIAEAGDRCRRIAARLVDGKAGALASRIDEMPSRLLSCPGEERVDFAIAELGKLVTLARAWRAAPADPELRREVLAAESRDEVLNAPASQRVASVWETLGVQIRTRRDGLVSVATWLLDVGGQDTRFALLLDFFPASAGRRSGAFAPGELFSAELAFYPARAPLRAVIARREPVDSEPEPPWPTAAIGPHRAYAEAMLAAPWRLDSPVLLPPGRIAADDRGGHWWRARDGSAQLPLLDPAPRMLLGAQIEAAAGVWSGMRFSLLAARTDWGRVSADA